MERAQLLYAESICADGSGRLLFAAAHLKRERARIYIADNDGKVVDSFGENKYSSSFFHTGFWQTWSPDCRFVYYQSGTNTVPYIVRRELSTGLETRVAGDMEGAPTDGGPIVSGFMECCMPRLRHAGISSGGRALSLSGAE